MTLNILASGQSNMAGRGTGGPSPLTANPLVQVWNNVNELGSNGTEFISPPDFGNSPWYSTANNLALWFADAAATALNETVNLVLVAKGSQSISHWSSTGDMYAEMKAVYQLTGLPPADVFLWHQGESDRETSGCAYKLSLLNLMARLRADGLLAYDAPTLAGAIVVGGDNSDLETEFNSNLNNLAADHPDLLYVNTSGLGLHDNVHFSGQGLYDLGLRYWDKYAQ